MPIILVVDVNECVEPYLCSVGGTCVNNEGSYDCTCHTGYHHVIDNEGKQNCSGKKQLSMHALGIISVEHTGNLNMIVHF